MLTIEEKIARSEHFAKLCGQAEIQEWQEDCEQLVAWLRELVERRKAPEIIYCKDCKAIHYDFCLRTLKPVDKEKDYCSLAERRTDE